MPLPADPPGEPALPRRAEPRGAELEPFRAGGWMVDPMLNRLQRDSELVRIEPRVMAVLCCLVAAKGRVVSRDDLFGIVWPDVVVNDEALSRAVSELRRALGDDPRQPRFVETIRKRGYRWIASVEAVASRGETRPAAAFAPTPTEGKKLGRAVVGGLAVVLVLLLAAVLLGRFLRPVARPALTLATRPLTTLPGREIEPAISPDGRQVVFAWDGGAEDGDYDLYLKRVDGENVLRLTHTEGFEGHPAWSPDGSRVAFVRAVEGGASIFTVSALGGPERELASLGSWSYGLDWSPDGRSIAFGETEGARTGITLLDTATFERRLLTRPGTRFVGDFKPAFSPDSRRLAFLRSERSGAQEVFVVDTAGANEPVRLIHGSQRVRGFDWADERELLLSSDATGSFGLWKVGLDGGPPTWLPVGEQQVFNPSVAPGGRRIVFESVAYELNVWRADLSAGDSVVLEPFVVSTRQDTDAAVAPDGKSVAFVSDRSGAPQLWRTSGARTPPLQLTRFERTPLQSPVWSPDGAWIAFQAAPSGFGELMVIDRDGRGARPLVSDRSHALPLCWSADGARVVFASDRTGAWQLWDVGVDNGEIRRLTEAGGISAAAAEDGSLYYTRPGDAELYRWVGQPGDPGRLGGDEGMPLGLRVSTPELWALVEGAVIVARVSDSGQATIERFDFSARESVEIARIDDFSSSSFTVPRSGEFLLFGRVERSTSDLMLAEAG